MNLSDIFDLGEQLGEGYAGVVYKGTLKKDWNGLSKGKPVALKIYKEGVLQDSNQLQRLRREYEAGSMSKNPRLIHAYDVIELNFDGKKAICLVMEFVEGRSLDEVPRLDSSEIIRLSIELVSAVSTLHENGIVHRDIKPGNIMALPHGEYFKTQHLKLGDFGVVNPSGGTTITGSNQFLGTIRNAAPEYLFGEEATPKSDMYSIGSVLYFMLTGREIYSEIEHFAQLILEKQKPVGISLDMLEANVKSVDWRRAYTRPSAGFIQESMNVLANVIRLCLSHSPSERPDAKSTLALLHLKECSPYFNPWTNSVIPYPYWHIVDKYRRFTTVEERVELLCPGVSLKELKELPRHTQEKSFPKAFDGLIQICCYVEQDDELKVILYDWLWDLATPLQNHDDVMDD